MRHVAAGLGVIVDVDIVTVVREDAVEGELRVNEVLSRLVDDNFVSDEFDLALVVVVVVVINRALVVAAGGRGDPPSNVL